LRTFAPFLVCLIAAGSAGAAERYVDGAREVTAERIGPATLDAKSRLLTPVRLRFDDRRVADAQVDASAIVRIDAGAEADAEAAIEAEGGELVRLLSPQLGLWLVESHGGADGLALASRLSTGEARARGVAEAVPNLYLRVKATADPYTPTDPRFGGQWYFENLEMPLAWGLSRGDASTSIVVIDTGCDLAHADLAAKMDPGLDVVDGDMDPSFEASDSGAAHGTACAGVAAAATDNGEGIAGGCPECRLRCVRFLSDVAVPLSATVDAFQFALDVDADVVSNSWGYVNPMPVPSSVADVIGELYTNGRGGKGALVLFAAGNDDREIEDDELQAAEGVLCIGAINNFDESTPFTNRGAAIDVVAPTGTLTTDISGPGGDDPTDYTSLFGGTSSACPVAAGVAGLLASAAPDKTAAELYTIMVETSRPAPFAQPDANGHDPIYGYGIIQPADALGVALGIAPGTGGGGAGGGGAGGAGGGDGDDGCGCAVAGRAGQVGSGAYLAALVAMFARRRRRASR
jgi:MYXO-CTERM domain-containing protein